MTPKQKLEEIKKEVKEALLNNVFDIVTFAGIVQIQCLGFIFSYNLHHFSKSINNIDIYSGLPPNEIQIYFTSEELKQMYKNIMSGGYDFALEDKRRQLKSIEEEIKILNSLKEKYSNETEV